VIKPKAWYAEAVKEIPPSSSFALLFFPDRGTGAPAGAGPECLKQTFLESAMQKPDLDTYLQFIVRALPDTANMAERLSAVMTVLQTARTALWDGQPDNVSRADAALTMALCALKLTSDEFDRAAEWAKSTVRP
jgi:hypothetical protein